MSSPEILSFHIPERRIRSDKCGITGGLDTSGQPVHRFVAIDMQPKLQNRGQDTAGIATYGSDGKLHAYKRAGLVGDVFASGFDFAANGLVSYVAIGHNRYATDDSGRDKDDMSGAQPMLTEWNGRSIAISYNGNLPDTERQKLKDRLPQDMPKEPDFDTADIGRAIASAPGETWEEKIKNGLQGVFLAYSLTMLTDKGELFGLRCPAGTWPLWVGRRGSLILLSSESIVDKSPETEWREVKPGELIKATQDGGMVITQIFPPTREARCVVNEMYGANGHNEEKDSIMGFNKEGKAVTYRQFRMEAGRAAAREHPIEADVYIGVPSTGIPIAEGYAEVMGRKATRGIIEKLNGNGASRSFIAKNNEEIHAIISGNLVYVMEKADLIRGKKIVVLDDTAIRGNSAGGHPLNDINLMGRPDQETASIKKVRGYVAHLKEDMGAKEVHLVLVLPKFVNGCDMGYFIRKNQLLAVVQKEDGTYEELTNDQIAFRLGADSVYFLSKEGVETVYETVLGRRDISCMNCMGEPHPLDLIASQPIVFSPESMAAAD